MATKTPNIGLIRPARGEFDGSWDIPMNKNADTLDFEIGEIQSEIEAARGTEASLAARIGESLNDDGTLKDVPEIAAARNSTVYGADDGLGNSFTLDQRLEKGDREVFDSRQGLDTLTDILAFKADDDVHNSILSAPNGFLTFTGAAVKVDGSVTPVVTNINGYRQVVRSLKSTTISGAAGTYYVYLERVSSGETILDRTGVGQNNGATSVDTNTNKLNKFTDSSQNFIASGVQPGDLLEITSTGSLNIGQYVVTSVVDANTLLVQGLFASTQANLNFKIINPIAPTLGFTDTAHSKKFERVDDRIYIGRAVFDGAQVTSVTSYSLKGRYESFISITLSGGDFSQTVSHNIGYVPRSVQFFASQANDYSQALEPLSTAEMNSSTLQRSVIADWTDMTLRVKNATNGVFYKSFDGVSQTAGFLLIVAER